MSILLKLGSPLIEDKLTSCQTLKKSGNTKSMIYNLKGENDQFPRFAYCDMENSEGYDDPSMEKKLGYVLYSPYDQRPDIFTVYEDKHELFTEEYLTFSKSLINIGNVFDRTEFTCRMDGYYEFSFAGTGYHSSESHIYVYIQKNGENVLVFYDREDDDSSTNSYFLMSFSWQMELKSGDKVRLRQTSSKNGFYIADSSGTYHIFNGKYIRPI